MVRVRLFAGLRDLAKQGDLDVPWREGLTVGQVRAELVRRLPNLAPLLDRSRAVVGDDLVANEVVVPDEAEVAFLPPVSGG